MPKPAIDQEALVEMFSTATAKQGKQLQDAVYRTTLGALQGRELTLKNIRSVLQSVTQAASAGAAQNPALQTVDAQALLDKAVAGMDAALLQAVEANRVALQQFVDQGVMGSTAFGHRPGRLGSLRLVGLIESRVGGLGQTALMPGDALLHGRGKVLPEVESVRDLYRFRCRGASCLRVCRSSVPADHRWLRVLLQPGRHWPGIASHQYIHDFARLAVDQHGDVVVATLESKVSMPAR